MKIPKNFVVGVSTSAFQIEGALSEDGRGPSIWDDFRSRQGDTGRHACDHYHRYRDDVEQMAALGCDAYRFSVAWPRVIPDGRGKVNARGLDFYSRLVDCLLEHGIEPWVSLYHWDLPLSLEQSGGWDSRSTAEHFADYSQAVIEALGDRVHRWFTVNEPWSVTVLGYQTGAHAPGRKEGMQTALRVIHHLLLAHGKALERIKAAGEQHQAGIVLNPWIPMPLTQRGKDRQAATQAWDQQVCWWFDPLYRGRYPETLAGADSKLSFEHVQDGDMDVISAPTHHLGLNMYFPGFVRHSETGESPFEEYSPMVNLPRSEMGWLSFPPGLSYLLGEVTRRYKPARIYITENGCAAPDVADDRGEIHDLFRQEYLRAHLLEALLAREQGIPLGGYFVWSLLDNFEWDRGYAKRFGLISMDYSSMRRSWKASAHWFKHVMSERHLGPGLLPWTKSGSAPDSTSEAR